MRLLLLVIFLVFTNIGSVGAREGDKLSWAQIKQFKKQCRLDATNNRRLCRCATRAFKKLVPPSAVRFGHHTTGVNIVVLQIAEEYVEIMAAEVEKCEDRHSRN